MCVNTLFYKADGAIYKNWPKKTTRKYWKVIRINQETKTACGLVFRYYQYSPGINSISKLEDRDNRECAYFSEAFGIHVYLDEKKAKEITDTTSLILRNVRMIPVYCEKDDLIIADNEQAAFVKVTIKQEDWDHLFDN